ncbi:hypothetical protein NP233_g4972 [Leucocoprinus birnbaumii]|uniref:DH domain-containing protein n=1 Tax=Leucocoprinus birnbaumii TaxID=56174 RepID=A0AAD5VU68_9AGAR|nr:hypothetical protein NP233_g4972 [Leucocoprinus birnbaumii]
MPSAKSKAGMTSHAGSTMQSPNFQPPSFYAAAGGIPYPRTPRQGSVSPQPINPSESADANHYERFMPISYIPDPSSSDSSFEYRPTRLPVPAVYSSNGSAKRMKRRSQIADLPQIEAQLLPSLRDTIDRMTRPPSRLAPPATIATETEVPSCDYRHDHGIHQPNFSSNAHDPSILQKRSRQVLSPQSLRPRDKAHAKNSPAPAFVSSLPKPLKSMATDDRSHDTPQPDTGLRKCSIGTPTLRSVKSLLSRKLSTNSTATVSSQESSRKLSLREALKSPKIRHDAKDNVPSPRKLQPPPSAAGAMSPPSKRPPDKTHPTQRPPALRQPSQAPKSNIPRLRARFAPELVRSQNTDTSDVEDHPEPSVIGQRKLTVVNVHDPISSSSDSDSDAPTHPATPTRLRPGVGLGLNCHFPLYKSPRADPSIVDSQCYSDESIQHTPRSSVASSTSSDSRYSTGSDEQESLFKETREERRQRVELLGHSRSSLDGKPRRHSVQFYDINAELSKEQDITYDTLNDLTTSPKTSSHPIYNAGGFRSPVNASRTRSPNSASATPRTLVPKGHTRSIQPDPEMLSRSARQDEGIKRRKSTIGSTIARLARRSLMVASQEREAFGLRPSDSEELHQQYEDVRRGMHGVNRMSGSSVGGVSIPPDDALSHGASHLLRSIEGEQQPPAQSVTTPRYDDNVGASPLDDMQLHSPDPVPYAAQPIQSDNSPLDDIPPLTSILSQLFETEEVFVANMRTCIQLYVIPLRVQGSRTWISGVPPHASRFLDWLEDILHLHERVLAISRGTPDRTLGELLQFLPSLEIYQPYIVRAGQFSQQLQRWIEEGNDFGRFVALQDKQTRRSRWSLHKYIDEPGKRLQKYLGLFSALLELTPQQSPKFLTIYSLLGSLELILDVLDTVKHEEEQHRILSSFLGRFHSTEPLSFLADRRRTLLWHGAVVLNLNGEATPRGHHSSRLSHKTRRLSQAITAWDCHVDAQSLDNRGLRDSVASYDAASDYSSSSSNSVDDSSALQPDTEDSTVVYAAVLSDVLLLGKYSSGSSDSYNLVNGIGMSRIFSFQNSDTSNMFLDVIPLGTIDALPNDVTASVKGLSLSVSPPGAPLTQDPPQDLLAALQCSAEYTQKLWCRPWKNQTADGNDVSRFLNALVHSGLPLPKSPSGRLPEPMEREGEAPNEEREERGWWSYRFHQVMSAKRQAVSNQSRMLLHRQQIDSF